MHGVCCEPWITDRGGDSAWNDESKKKKKKNKIFSFEASFSNESNLNVFRVQVKYLIGLSMNRILFHM